MKKHSIPLFTIILAFCVISLTGASSVETPSSFTAHIYQSEQGETISYYLYTPANAEDNMPLIVYLHGGSGKGNDLSLILSSNGLPRYLQENRLSPSAYVLIPQLSNDYRGWSDNAEVLMKLISDITAEYTIDKDRINLTGHSMGGTGVWQLAASYPNTFSAAAPLSGSVQVTPSNIQRLNGISVWAVAGTEDHIVSPSSSIQMIQALSDSGGNAQITLLNDVGHFDVPAFYLDEDAALLNWLTAQSCG